MKSTRPKLPAVSAPKSLPSETTARLRRRSYDLIEPLEARIAPAHVFVVVNGNTLQEFESASPGTITKSSPLTGLGAGETLIGIDFRPATGALYAVTKDAGNVGRLYTINTANGAATFAATLGADPADLTSPYSTLSGSQFGMDFNPVPDRLRLVSDTGQDLRINVTNGLVTTDANLNPGVPVVAGSAYTNSFAGATSTTLYGIDSATDRLVIQNPPNNGTLTTVGLLGVDTTAVVAFDILTTGDKAVPAQTALSALQVGGTSALYSINLTSGAATLIGMIGNGSAVSGLSIQPEPANLVNGANAVALDGANNLLRFNTATPGTIVSSLPLTGLTVGDAVIGFDFRPATGVLYAITKNGGSAKLYTVNTTTAVATFSANLAADPADTTSPFTGLSGTSFGVNFNPVADRLRVVSDADQNLRINVDTGLVTTDGALNPGNPNIVAAAYTNSFVGAASTTLYGIDSVNDTLVIQNPPNNGTLVTVGALGIDASAVVGFDIRPGLNTAFATMVVGGTPSLYSIDLTSGAATLVSAFGGGTVPSAFALIPSGTIQFSAPTYSATEAGFSGMVTVQRVGGSDGAITATLTASDLTAVAGADYTQKVYTVTFANGASTAQQFDFPITNDVAAEDLETFRVILSNPGGGATLGRSTAIVAIADNEILPANAFAVDTSGNLLRFNTAAPGTIVSTVPIAGLAAGDTVLGIDFRPSTGVLYAITGNAGVGHLYTIDQSTGAATFSKTLTADPADTTSPFTALSGTSFGVDFNPVADRLRVVSDTEQNLRINVDTGLVTTDSALNPGDPNVVGSAYSNSVAQALTTTLYGIDSVTDSLLVQSPPNNGTLASVGPLGVDVSGVLGFDIRSQNGVNTGLAAFAVGGSTGLYLIDLTTGAASLLGNIGSGSAPVKSIAIAPTLFSSTRVGSVATLTGSDIGDNLVITESGGLLKHNRFSAGDSGFNSDFDFDSTAPGDQPLAAWADSTVAINTGAGRDRIEIGAITPITGSDGPSFVIDSGIDSDAIVINAGGNTGMITITAGAGDDRIDFSSSTSGVIFDLDHIGVSQPLNGGNLRVVLTEAIESFTGSNFDDIIRVDASAVIHSISGGGHASGDQLIVDAEGSYGQISRSSVNGGTVHVPGFAQITYDTVEQVRVENSTATNLNPGGFAAAVSTATGPKPVALAAGDLNGDGHMDAVTANQSGTISILLNQGSGGFSTKTISSKGKLPGDVVLGDLDGDGDLDIVVSNSKSNRVSVFFNDGNGEYTFTKAYGAGKAPTALAIGDLDGDGDLDILAVNSAKNSLSLLKNDGTGALAAPLKIASGGSKPKDVAIADLNADGHADILVVNSGGKGNVAFLAGSAGGAFDVDPVLFAVQDKPASLALADLDADGLLDVVVSDSRGRFVGVLIGNGTAAADQFDAVLKIAAVQSYRGTAIATGDLNGDGFADLVQVGAPGNKLQISLGNGGDSFGIPFSAGSIGSTGSALAVADFNGDGIADIIVADRKGGAVNVVLRTPAL